MDHSGSIVVKIYLILSPSGFYVMSNTMGRRKGRREVGWVLAIWLLLVLVSLGYDHII